MKYIAVVLMILGAEAVLFAQDRPKVQRSGEADFTVIQTKMRFTTLILLPVGEEIADVICGDKDYWVIEGRDNIVYVKPSKEGARTNVNIVSKNKVVYSFLVQEVTKPGGREKPDLKVVLGEDELVRAKRDNEKLTEALTKTLHKSEDPEARAELDKQKKKMKPSLFSLFLRWLNPPPKNAMRQSAI